MSLGYRDARELRDVLERVLGLHHDFFQLVEVLRAVLDELLVLPAVPEDLLHHPVQDRDVRAGPELHVQVGLLASRGEPRVGVDDLRAVHLGLHHPAPDQRVLLKRVRPEDETALRLRNVPDRVGHRPGAKRRRKPCNRRCVAEPRTVVDVPGLHDPAGELHHRVVLLVGDTRR